MNIKGYLAQYYQPLMEIVVAYINRETEDEDNETWTVTKGCLYILHLLTQVIPSDIMDKIIHFIECNIQNEDINLKNSAILIFHACIGNSHKIHISDLVIRYMGKLIKLMFDENNKIKRSISQLFVKITKHCSRLLDTSVLNNIIPSFITALSLQNNIAINYCQSLINLIKTLGDVSTTKNSSKYNLNRSHFIIF
jgi:importin subunit beta-1